MIRGLAELNQTAVPTILPFRPLKAHALSLQGPRERRLNPILGPMIIEKKRVTFLPGTRRKY